MGIQFWGLQVIEARLPGLSWTPGQSLSGGWGLQGSRGSGAVTHPLLPSLCMEQWGQEEGCGGQNGGSTVTGCSLGLRGGLVGKSPAGFASWVLIPCGEGSAGPGAAPPTNPSHDRPGTSPCTPQVRPHG